MKEQQGVLVKDKKSKEQTQFKLALILCAVSVVISLSVIIGVTLF
jgi:hypothetical protein